MSSKNDKILPLTKYLTIINVQQKSATDHVIKVLDKRTGNLRKIDLYASNKADPQLEEIRKVVVEKTNQTLEKINTNDVEIVLSVNSQLINFQLKTSDGPIEPKAGFLVEVFHSGSDGKLKRLYTENLEDPLDEDNVISDGFGNYFKLEVDV